MISFVSFVVDTSLQRITLNVDDIVLKFTLSVTTGLAYLTIIVVMLRHDLRPAGSTIGKRIREARVRADMTQEELGVAIGLDEGPASARISRYESGVHFPSSQLIQPLADALAVPAPYLVTEHDRIAALLIDLYKLDDEQLDRVEELIAEVSTQTTDFVPRL